MSHPGRNCRFLAPIPRVVVALGVVLLAAACGDDDGEPFPIEARDFEFYNPTTNSTVGNVFRSAPDSDVAITNTGSETHSFTVDDLEIDQVLEPGAEMIIDLPGGETIAFYCQFHPDRMFGTITSREVRVQSSYQ